MIDLLQQALKIKTDGLFLCVLGPSGAGKSHFIGTYPGRVLFLHGAGEAHGAASAVKSNKDVISVSWSQTPEGPVEPRLIPKRIREILDPEVIKKAGIKCVAIDSLTNLCLDFKETEMFKQRCAGRNGHNTFKESEAMIEMISKVINQLQVLSDQHDVDVIVTMDLQINQVAQDGTILESKPGLPTFGVGKAVVQQFADVLVLGRINSKPMFQNLAKVASKSVDRETQEVVKYIEYNPRLRGVTEMPATIEPTVAAIQGLKK